jgi:hypothetical protein
LTFPNLNFRDSSPLQHGRQLEAQNAFFSVFFFYIRLSGFEQVAQADAPQQLWLGAVLSDGRTSKPSSGHAVDDEAQRLVGICNDRLAGDDVGESHIAAVGAVLL